MKFLCQMNGLWRTIAAEIHTTMSHTNLPHTPLSEELKSLLHTEAEALTVAELVERVGDRGFGLLLVVLSLPSALPVPAAGYSVPFGMMLAVLAVQMMLGKRHPVFPRRMQRASISRNMADRLLGGAAWMFRRVEWLVRPRLRWIGSRAGLVFMGVLVLIMAVLMMIPIPMTNTFPAFVIFLIGIGLTEEDGLFAFGACIVGVLAVALYAGLVWAIIVHGPEVAETIKDAIKGFLAR